MADPNQTPARGEWACPCAGCEKAVDWERKQLIDIFNNLGMPEASELIEDRISKKAGRK